MNTSCIVDASFAAQTPVGQVEFAELEGRMLSQLLNGNTRGAVLSYHDAMVVDVREAKAVVRALADVHGIRLRRIWLSVVVRWQVAICASDGHHRHRYEIEIRLKLSLARTEFDSGLPSQCESGEMGREQCSLSACAIYP